MDTNTSAIWEEKKKRIENIINIDAIISIEKSSYNCMYPQAEFEKIKSKLPHTSAYNYTQKMIDMINRFPDGLVLDCGAGAKKSLYNNVINLEIFPYEGTDIVAEGSNLPFKDNSIDAVLSLAVLEHVKDPFKVASEMQRVLKPGGLLWIDVAFMQPYHGFPHHYYNMTQSGLNELMGEDMTILESGTPEYGTPIWSLSWILMKYVNNLPEPTRAKFLNLKVSDLAMSAQELLHNDYVSQLSAEANQQLAATVSLLAEKRSI